MPSEDTKPGASERLHPSGDLPLHLDGRGRETRAGAPVAALARAIDGPRADDLAARLAPGSYAHLLATAYPALAQFLERDVARGVAIVPTPVDRGALAETLGALPHDGAFRDRLRIATREFRLRIALRELLPAELGGADVHETARELSDLADATIEAALAEATTAATARFGPVRALEGGADRGKLVVLGLGKLGGRELNAGSDVDLVCFYDTDAAECVDPRGGDAVTPAHVFWTKVVQRMSENLAEVTAEGFVWRVDHRLRPEGARGALVNSLAAAERYYETFGRLWERAAFLRARVVAGDRDLGAQLFGMLTPFVWTRRVDPSIAEAMYDLVHRARAELSRVPERDLKLGPGGIREAEFFVQALQLIWGGREARVREQNTLRAAQRLRVAGLVTEREAEDLTRAYLALRRTEHAIQWSTGVQTHSLPTEEASLSRIARALGHPDAAALIAHLEDHCTRVSELLTSLLPEGEEPRQPRWQDAIHALDRGDYPWFVAALSEAGMSDLTGDGEQLARDLFETARQHPDGVIGVRTRERHRPLVETLLDAVADAADPAQAARFLRGFAARVRPVSVYTRLLADEPAAMRRLVTAFGASAFVGEVVSTRPELADLVVFERAVPTMEDARDEVLDALPAPNGEREDLEAQVGRVRRAKQRVTMQVALADLADEIDTRGATLVLSALADASLEAAAHFALGQPAGAAIAGLAIVAMGKLGGREIGYGSDLDVIFVYDPNVFEGDDPAAFYTRAARRIIQIIGMAHPEGRGYELDTRLRPSGSQGLLVVSLESFARYHAVTPAAPPSGRGAATWERLALLRARFAAGDADLGRRVIAIARAAAFERPSNRAEIAADIARLRQRMEVELARERPGRYDLKLGRGGLVDVEFAVQLLQLVHGQDASLRSTETRPAIEALDRAGLLSGAHAQALRDGYAFLRRLEQRIRVLHGDSSHLIEEDAAGLGPLARRMGIYDVPAHEAAKVLVERYRQVTHAVREAYEDIVEALAR